MAALYKCRSELQVRNGKLQDVADVARDPRHAGKDRLRLGGWPNELFMQRAGLLGQVEGLNAADES